MLVLPYDNLANLLLMIGEALARLPLAAGYTMAKTDGDNARSTSGLSPAVREHAIRYANGVCNLFDVAEQFAEAAQHTGMLAIKLAAAREVDPK